MKVIWTVAWMAVALSASASALAAGQDFESLAKRCAPDVHPLTLAALVRKESGFDPLTIGVNSNPHRSFHPASLSDAVNQAQGLIHEGQSIDVGLGQVNNRNFKKLGLSIADAFDGCRNLAAASRLLKAAYQQYRAAGLDEASALDASLSTYNTGDSGAGIDNGYVAGVRAIANGGGYVVPALGAAGPAITAAAPPGAAPPTANQPGSVPAAWDVFGDASGDAVGFVFSPKATPGDDKGTQPSALPPGRQRGVSQGVVSGGGTASQPVDGPVVLFAEPSTVAIRRPSPPS